ncbi:MAG: hypothetical protein IJU48_05470 [Synergistaceae bacterium]|nr:hypothetical protein [Synergistaceae bacterium]
MRLLRINDVVDARDFEIDDEAPDYVIATDFIYVDPKAAKKFKQLIWDRREIKRPVTIFFTEECSAPDLNIFDYSITWNWDMNYLDRTARIPPHMFIGLNEEEFINDLTYEEALRLLRDGEKDFCNFIYSNWDAPTSRDELFYALSSYKHVDSLGKHLNNIGALITYGGGGAQMEETRLVRC